MPELSRDDMKMVLTIEPETKAVEKALDDIAKHVKGTERMAAGAMGAAVGGGGGASILGAVGGMLGSILGPAGALAGAGVGAGMAGAASMAPFKQMELAIADIGGVIGQSFLPFIQIATDAFRLFGDILANIIPNFSEVQGALAEFRHAFADFGAEIRNVLADIGPMIRDFLIDALREAAHWMSVLTRVITILVSHLRLALGGASPGTLDRRSSVGASAQAASITGINEYQQKLQTAAFSMPGTKSNAEQQVDLLGDIARAQAEAENIANNIESFLRNISEGVTNIIQWMQKFWDRVGSEVKEAKETVRGSVEAGKASVPHPVFAGPAIGAVLTGKVLGRVLSE